MDGNDPEGNERRAEWSPSPTWLRVGARIGPVVALALFGAGYLRDVAAIGSAAWIYFLPTLMIAIPTGRTVYEVGRYVAARRSGMVVAVMRIGPVDVVPRRKGWRVRWKRYIHPLPPGYVHALPDPSRPLRMPMIRFALGGAVATVALATLVASSIPLLQTYVERWSMAGLALALLIPLSSLFPNPSIAASAVLESGGVMAWRWWRHPPADAWMARTLALSRVLRGTPISALGPEDIDILLDDSVSGAWYALKQHQQRGEWTQVTDVGRRMDTLIPGHRYAKSALAELIDVTRSEIAFAAAVTDRDAARLPTPDALRRSRWGNSPLAARCAAWRAHLTGDIEAWQSAMDECIRVAENSVDRSLAASERLIAKQLYGDVEPMPGRR